MKNTFIREKAIHCGKDFLMPEIFPYTGRQQQAVRGRRKKKIKVTEPAQKNLNDRRAKRYFVQLALANFGKARDKDVVIHLTYAPEFLPGTEKEAHKIAVTYLRRVAYLRKKKGLPPLKYILVTQVGRKRNGTHRIHHHILMNGGLDRDELESLWWKKGRPRGKRQSCTAGQMPTEYSPTKRGSLIWRGIWQRIPPGKSTGHNRKTWTSPITTGRMTKSIPAARSRKWQNCRQTARNTGNFGNGNTQAGN